MAENAKTIKLTLLAELTLSFPTQSQLETFKESKVHSQQKVPLVTKFFYPEISSSNIRPILQFKTGKQNPQTICDFWVYVLFFEPSHG